MPFPQRSDTSDKTTMQKRFNVEKNVKQHLSLEDYHYDILNICKHTIRESFESEHRKPTTANNVRKVYGLPTTVLMQRVRQNERTLLQSRRRTKSNI